MYQPGVSPLVLWKSHSVADMRSWVRVHSASSIRRLPSDKWAPPYGAWKSERIKAGWVKQQILSQGLLDSAGSLF